MREVRRRDAHRQEMCTVVRIVGTIVRMTTIDHFAGDPRTHRERMLAGDLERPAQSAPTP
jgi:hypothetical protein